MADTQTTWTQQELVDEARRRFGDDHWAWAFRCPICGDVATAADFRAAGAEPERIGRHLGALQGPPTDDNGRSIATRGCDWAAYGLFRGPWLIVMPDGHKAPSFPLAEAADHA